MTNDGEFKTETSSLEVQINGEFVTEITFANWHVFVLGCHGEIN